MAEHECPYCKIHTQCLKKDQWSKELHMYLFEHRYCTICNNEYFIKEGIVTCYDQQGKIVFDGNL